MSRLLAISAALLLSACAAAPALPPAPVIVRVSPPVELLSCADQPAPGVMRSQRDIAKYILDLAEDGADCRSKLDAVRDFVEKSAPIVK